MYKQIKNRFVSLLLSIVAVFTLIPITPAFAAELQEVEVQDTMLQGKNVSILSSTLRSGDRNPGSGARISSNTTVYSNSSLNSSIGSLSTGEGVTVIWYDDTVAYINYSSSTTSAGKFGYVSLGKLRMDSNTDVGIVKTASSTYYDTTRTHSAGSVSQGEYVVLISRADGWDYIEYNVSGGKRKRAFVPSSCIDHQYGTASGWHYFNLTRRPAAVDGWTPVYSGPDSLYYAECGSITPADTDMYSYFQDYDRNGNAMSFISYHTSSGVKYGWILFVHEW